MARSFSRPRRRRRKAEAKSMTRPPSLIERIITGSFAKPVVALLLIAAGAAVGGMWLGELRRDVFPDLSAPVFNVIVQNASMGAEELETAIAIPMEVALSG